MDAIAAPTHTTGPNSGSEFCEEDEASNDDVWIPVTPDRSQKLEHHTKYSTKYENQPTGQHIGTFKRFASLASRCSNNGVQNTVGRVYT
jgi:hypothetical protein